MPTETDYAGALISNALELGPACLTCSFQAEDVLVLHLLRERAPEIPVLFLETGYHFPATLALRDQLASAWQLNLINVAPDATPPELYRTDPAACCRARKVAPLQRALAPYAVWFTGLRRAQSPTRAQLRDWERHRLPGGTQLFKVNPLADWSDKQVWDYTLEHRLPYLPLYDQGYRSIGCEPCTAPVAPGADPRSGRWGGTKLECGIHTFTELTGAGPGAATPRQPLEARPGRGPREPQPGPRVRQA